MMVREQIQADSHLRLGHTDDDEQNIDFHFLSVFLYVDQAAISIWSELGISISLYSMDTIRPFSWTAQALQIAMHNSGTNTEIDGPSIQGPTSSE